MNEDAIRDAVRAALARHLGPAAPPPDDLRAEVRRLSDRAAELVRAIDDVQRRLGAQPPGGPGVPRTPPSHSSHFRFAVPRGGTQEGSHCLIEPSVHCVQCGFCESLGH